MTSERTPFCRSTALTETINAQAKKAYALFLVGRISEILEMMPGLQFAAVDIFDSPKKMIYEAVAAYYAHSHPWYNWHTLETVGGEVAIYAGLENYEG